MEKRVLVFGASSSAQSINKKLATFVAGMLDDVEANIIDLRDNEPPLFSVDKEAEHGIPEVVQNVKRQIQEADGVIVSFAEHNGLPTAAYKNLNDWLSRIDQKVWEDKPMFIMATSPGKRGGSSVLGIMKSVLPHAGGNVIADFSLPSFYDHFNETGVTDPTLKEELKNKTLQFRDAL